MAPIVINIVKAVGRQNDKARLLFFDRPGRREAARHQAAELWISPRSAFAIASVDVAVGQAAGGRELLPLQLAGDRSKNADCFSVGNRMAACSINPMARHEEKQSLSPVVCQHRDQIIAHRAVEPERTILLLEFKPPQRVDDVGRRHIGVEHFGLVFSRIGLAHRGEPPVPSAGGVATVKLRL
jgi:hypothetical protein